MSGPEPRQPDDRRLDDFLAGRDPLSRAYHEGASEAPPPELDTQVLQAARDALQRQPEGPATAFRDRRWRYAIAAVIVLSFSTLLLIHEDPVARKAVQMEADVIPAPVVVTPAPAIPESVNPQPAQVPPPPALRRERAASAPPPSTVSEEAPAAAAEAAPASAPEAPRAARRVPAEAEMRDEMAAPAAAAPQAAPAPAPAPAAPAADAPAAAGASTQKLEAREQTSPEGELQRIRALLAEGRRAEAREALRAFRQRYPEYELPADLAAFAEER